MTLEEIYKKMKQNNPYYEGSQAQKEEQAGMNIEGDTVKHTEKSAQIHQDYVENQPAFNTFITGAPTYKEQLKDNFIQIKRRTKNLGKNFISGVGNGIRGIMDVPFQETENNLKKGENSNKNLWQHILKSTAYTLNPNVSFIDNIISSNKNATNILKDKNKSDYEKVANIVTNGVTDVVDASTTGKKGLDASIELLGKLSQNNSEKLSDKVQNVQNKVDEPFKKYDEKVQKDNNKFGNVENFLFNVSNSLGNMVPSIVASAVTKNPNIGLATMGYSVKGQSTEEAREKGQELQKAIDIGNTKGAIEAGTELLTGGINFFGKGALDDIAKRGIDNKVKNQVLNFIAKKGYDFAGEIGEETVSDILNTMLDKGTTDPNIKYSIKDWSDTALSTLLSTAVLNTIGGGYTKKAYKQNAQELKNNTGIITKDIDNIEMSQLPRNTTDDSINNIVPQNNSKNNITQTSLPIRNYQYIESDNSKINALRQDMSKYWKDTNEARALGSVIEKVISDKGYNIRLDDTINKKGTSVNAQITTLKNGEVEIKINPNAQNVGEFLLMHEVTHAVETPEIRNLIVNYASKNKEFNQAVENLKKTYKTNDISSEVVADISGQLFGNQEFINNLSVEKPNIFKRIYNKIIELANKFTGNSRYDLFVKDLKNKWETAYRTQNNNLDNNTYYSQKVLSDGTMYIEAEKNQFLKSDGTKMSEREMYESLVGSIIDFGDGDKAKIIKRLPGKDMYNELYKRYPSKYNNIENLKLLNTNVNENIKELLKNSKMKEQNVPDYKKRHEKQGINNFDTRTVKFYDGNSAYNIDFSIAILEDGTKVAYAKKYFEYNDELTKKIKNVETKSEKSLLNQHPFINNSIAPSNDNVNTITKYSIQESENNSGSFNLKEKQLEVINKNNPMQDDYHTGIRTIEDIKTLEETIQDEEWAAYDEYNPDLSRQDIENVIKAGKITVYSSYPIKQGVFVSPSRMEAESYSGNGKVYSKEVNINDVAWIDPTQGQYAEIDNKKYSQSNQSWQKYLEKNFKSEGIRTNLQDIKLPTKEWIENRQKLKKSQNNIAIAKEYMNKNTLNPLQISNLTENDVTTTPKLPDIKYKTDKGKKSDFYDNLMNKTGMLNDDLRKIIKNQDDIKYYEGVTNAQSLREANERLQKDGSKETLRWFSKDLSDKNTNVSAAEVAEGWILLKQYQDAEDYESAVKVAKRMRDMATKSGQALQAYSIKARLTPEGMFQYAQSELKEAFEKFSKNKTQDWINKHKQDFDLKPEETQAIINKVKEAQNLPNDSYEKKEKLAEIQKIMTDKLPPERGAGIKSWMRISMLFNPKTQVRNILGNAIVSPVNAVGDVVSSIADKALSKKTGVRTVGLSNPVQNIKGFKKGLYESYSDFKKGINTREISGDRFEIGEGKSFKDKGLGKALNRVDQLLNFMLDAGDRPFYEATFTNSINNQLILNNTDIVTQDMIDIATNEALSRTWQDNNNYTKFVLSIRNAFNGKFDIGKIHTKGFRYGLGDVLIPFAKTPANLTKAIVDYSPIGLVNSLVEGNNIRKAIGRSDLTAQQQHHFVQNLGKATAGTMLYVLGYALAKVGITSGESDEDKDVANFVKNTLGTSQYSIKIGNKTFTYDWAQPIAAPIAMMANLVNKDSKEENLLEKITSILDIPMNMILEQSFMQSIQEVLSNNGGVIEGVIQQVLDLPSRAVPTFLKQITDMTDTTQRTTYEKGKPIQTAINKVKAKTPGLSRQLAPVSNTLGNDIKKYGGETNKFLYAFHTFINPANINASKQSVAGSEIYKIYKKTGDKTIFPRQASYSQTIDGTNITLTSQERYEYQKSTGKYVNKVVNELLKNKTYKNLKDSEKAKILTEIASDSNEIAKEKLAKEKKLKYERPDTDVKIDDLVSKGLEYGNAYIYKTQVNSIKGDKKGDKAISGSANAKKAKYIINMDANDNQKNMMLSLLTDTDVKPNVSDLKKLNGNYLTYMQQSGKRNDKGISEREKYMMYIDAGIPVNTLNDFYSKIGKIEGKKNSSGKTISGSKKKAIFNYINSLSLSSTQKKILFTKCNSSYGKNYKSEIHTYINNLKISKERKEQIWNELYK